ncbi:DUF1266 domain-containing protein [Aminipila butyrica]|uniref:DUF1266 domain-containing protein n=1 Tax=Aminipila butyrica TaxID=433296 RepID=A0A858BZ72_9FIRM|nr:DUF1266 domain-containing protein [Aminipila butyrica]QIB69376.1 DUF1266 domain-containing protein [Aminipila butyrica]
MMKKALQENYGIRSRKTMQDEIDSFTMTICEDCAIYGLLIELYLFNPTKFLHTTSDEAQVLLATLLEDNQKNPLGQIWKALQLREAQGEYVQNISKTAANFFEDENMDYVRELYELFQKNRTWLTKTGGMSFAGFQLSRIISILADSHMCGYLSDDAARKSMDYYGAIAEQLFPNWEAFLFSAVLGKQMMSGASGQFIIGAADYIASCCALAAHPSKLLELSEVWVGSDTTFFVNSFTNYS